MKAIEEIKEYYNEGYYDCDIKHPGSFIYKEGHIFDDDQTIRWNREIYE